MTLSVVVPVYQEEEVLPFFIDKLISELNSLGLPFEIIFVLDPSLMDLKMLFWSTLLRILLLS